LRSGWGRQYGTTPYRCLHLPLWFQHRGDGGRGGRGEYARHLPGVAIARNYMYMCSEPGQNLIKQDAAEQGLKQVVVASCSPRMHEPTFRKAAQTGGVNFGRVEMANIREQCSWVHKDRAEATEKAKALVASIVAKAAYLEALEERQVGVTPAL